MTCGTCSGPLWPECSSCHNTESHGWVLGRNNLHRLRAIYTNVHWNDVAGANNHSYDGRIFWKLVTFFGLSEINKNKQERSKHLLNHCLDDQVCAILIREYTDYYMSVLHVSENKKCGQASANCSEKLGRHIQYSKPFVKLTSIFS